MITESQADQGGLAMTTEETEHGTWSQSAPLQKSAPATDELHGPGQCSEHQRFNFVFCIMGTRKPVSQGDCENKIKRHGIKHLKTM